MSIFSSNRQQTLWAQLQTGGPRAINNAAGVWAATGAKKLRYDTLAINPQDPVNTPTYKTGNRSPMIGTRGHQGCTWSVTKPFIPSGAAGTTPDDDPILQAIFGAANTTVATTSVTYSLGETLYYLFLSRYNKTPSISNPTNVYILGGVPQTVKFTGGGNFLNYSVDGVGVGAGDSLGFALPYAGFDAVLSGALTTYPAEPGSATTNGNVIPGFGSGAGFKFGGSSLAEVRTTIEIQMSLGIDVVADAINDPYPIAFIPGLRQISVSKIQCIDSDGTVLNALKAAALSKAPTAMSMQFGNVAGSIVTFNLANVQPGNMSWVENGAALDVSFDTSMAHQTTISAGDDMTLVCT
jgi:hypothetical protein